MDVQPAAHAPAPISAPDLVRQELDPIDWGVAHLVPQGLTLLLGPPRIGKRELCLDLALGGGGALGTLDVEPGEVLYLALEHTRRRLQERMLLAIRRPLAHSPKLEIAISRPNLTYTRNKDRDLTP